MTIAEQIYTIVKNLPEAQASEVLAFAEFVRSRDSIANSSTDTTNASVPWTELVYALAGAWADDFPDLETIRVGMGPDILRESL